MTLTQLVAFYKEAEKRATPCAGGRKGTGMAFSIPDRQILLQGLRHTSASLHSICRRITGLGSTTREYAVVYKRFTFWQEQEARGVFHTGHPKTGESIIDEQQTTFDGRIKTRADVQPAFNRAAIQLVRVGITNVMEAQGYLANAFEFAKVEQKIEISADRVVRELQVGNLTKDQIIAVLEKVKAKF